MLQFIKKQNYFLFFMLICLMVSPGENLYAQKKSTLQVNSDAHVTYQSIDGFGASDAWRAQFVGKNWPIDKRNYIADLLFSQEFDKDGNPKGIGLSLWRFYLAAGTAEQGSDSEIGSDDNPWRRGECFQNADGTYDWDKHKGQRWFLDAAKKRGVEKLLAFTIAAPVHMSNNGKGFATKGDIRFNVKPGKLDDYANYLVDVMEFFNDEGIFFDYLSPINEPQWNWDGHSQEGTPALNEEMYSFVKYISAGLSSRGLDTRIVIGEAGTIGHAAVDMSGFGMPSDGRDNQAHFFFSEDSPFYIGGLPNVEKTISAHSYQSVWPLDKQVEYRFMVNQALQQVNPDLGYWQSEYCILQNNDEITGGWPRDLTMKTALYVARIIHHDMVLTNAKSWQWWTAITQCNFKDGLVYLDDGSEGETGKMWEEESLQNDGEVRESKLMWVLGNYSRFVRPGMVRFKCELSEEQSPVDGLLVSAYKDPQKGEQVYVLTNLSEEGVKVDFGQKSKASTYTTDKDRDMEFSEQPLSQVNIPARSVVTVLR